MGIYGQPNQAADQARWAFTQVGWTEPYHPLKVETWARTPLDQVGRDVAVLVRCGD